MSIVAFLLTLSNKRTRQGQIRFRILAGLPSRGDAKTPCEVNLSDSWRLPMWKRDEAVKPTVPAGSGSTPAPTAAPPAAEAVRTHSAPSEPQRGMERSTVNIGKSVVIKGELSGSEDLTIEGQVEGTIVTCPLHAAMFDLTTGENLSPPATIGVSTYDVRIEGDDVMVRVD